MGEGGEGFGGASGLNAGKDSEPPRWNWNLAGKANGICLGTGVAP